MKDNKQDFAETKLSLKLGEFTYKLSFGVYTRRRIEETHPGFEMLGGSLADFEVIPFLIQKAIEPEDHKWKSEKEFIELYEACTDEENLKLIPLAYQNSVGFTNQRFEPLIQRLTKIFGESQAAKEAKIKELPKK